MGDNRKIDRGKIREEIIVELLYFQTYIRYSLNRKISFELGPRVGQFFTDFETDNHFKGSLYFGTYFNLWRLIIGSRINLTETNLLFDSKSDKRISYGFLIIKLPLTINK